MSQERDLRIEPDSLLFEVKLGKTLIQKLDVTNLTDQRLGFKVRTTAPKRYCVRPNCGILQPHQTSQIEVLLQPLKELPPDLDKCADKFLVLSNSIASDGDDLKALWTDEGSKSQKLRCVLTQPKKLDPIPSPTHETPESEVETAPPTTAPAASTTTAAAAPAVATRTSSTTSPSAHDAKYQKVLQDIQSLQTKHAAMSTQHRAVFSSITALKKQLLSLKTEREEQFQEFSKVRAALAECQQKPVGSDATQTKSQGKKKGFPIVPVIAIAVAAFAAGFFL